MEGKKKTKKERRTEERKKERRKRENMEGTKKVKEGKKTRREKSEKKRRKSRKERKQERKKKRNYAPMHCTALHCTALQCAYREVYLLSYYRFFKSHASDRYFELFVTVIILNIEGTILSDMILKHKGRKKQRKVGGKV